MAINANERVFRFEAWYTKGHEVDRHGHRLLDLDGEHIKTNVLVSGYVIAAAAEAASRELEAHYGERFAGCRKLESTDSYAPGFAAKVKRRFARQGVRVGR